MSRLSDIKARVAALKGVKHTPGPWIDGLSADGGRVNVYANETLSLRIARVDSDQEIGIDAKANAKLIASAPEAIADRAALVEMVNELVQALLKVQVDIQRVDFDCESSRWEYVIGYIRAALAKVVQS